MGKYGETGSPIGVFGKHRLYAVCPAFMSERISTDYLPIGVVHEMSEEMTGYTAANPRYEETLTRIFFGGTGIL